MCGTQAGGSVAAMRVLIVEDEARTAEIVRRYLERAGYDVSLASDSTEGLRLIEVWQPSLIILDVNLPGLDGIEVCRRVRATSRTPIIMLTARVLERDRVDGLLSGADDYVTKPFSPRELVARVYAVLRRAPASEGRSPMTAEFGRLRLDPLERRAFVDGRNVLLTPKEFGLLEALCSTPNVPWTRSRLLERVFGFDYEGTERSVDTHVLNLRRKLGDTGYPRVHTVFGVGYKIVAK